MWLIIRVLDGRVARGFFAGVGAVSPKWEGEMHEAWCASTLRLWTGSIG